MDVFTVQYKMNSSVQAVPVIRNCTFEYKVAVYDMQNIFVY
jgi:hypothetical protein